MKVYSVSCSKPTLFRGSESKTKPTNVQPQAVTDAKTEVKSAPSVQIQQQPKQDLVQISAGQKVQSAPVRTQAQAQPAQASDCKCCGECKK